MDPAATIEIINGADTYSDMYKYAYPHSALYFLYILCICPPDM